MLIDEDDQHVVRWALEKAYTFEYRRQNDLPDPCLPVQLGLSTAFFHKGKLVYWSADCPGSYLDQLMLEMTSLFAMCSTCRAYVSPEVVLTPAEEISLKAI